MAIQHPYNAIALHPTRECNLKCPFCYRATTAGLAQEPLKPKNFFIELVPYLKQVTHQVALGGGEPLLDLPFMEAFGKECREYKLTLNVTTNGKRFLEMTDSDIQTTLANIQMVSVSFDYFKWGAQPHRYAEIIHRLKKLMVAGPNPRWKKYPFQTGANLLLDRAMVKNNGIPFFQIVVWLFHEVEVDRVFVLYPKNGEFLDILKFRNIFEGLTRSYSQFYVDDLIKQILKEGYNDWQHPCHFGKDLLSIDEYGGVYGCSFDNEPISIINQPLDLLKVQELVVKPRYECPYFPKPQFKK